MSFEINNSMHTSRVSYSNCAATDNQMNEMSQEDVHSSL